MLDYERRREILARFPHAERLKVKGHTEILQLYGDSASAEDWLKLRREVLVLG